MIALAQAGGLPQDPTSPDKYPNIWSLDVLLSNDGFGLGTIYRRSVTPDLSWFVSFSISEAKDEREVEYYDPYYGTSVTPGKLNRFMVLPLMGGVQYRLFRDDIVDTFRPYLNAGAGPTMVYMMPYVQLTQQTDGSYTFGADRFFQESRQRATTLHVRRVCRFRGKLRNTTVQHLRGQFPLLFHVSSVRWASVTL